MVWPEGYIDDNAKEENWAALMGLYKAGQKPPEVLPDARLMHTCPWRPEHVVPAISDQMDTAAPNTISLGYPTTNNGTKPMTTCTPTCTTWPKGTGSHCAYVNTGERRQYPRINDIVRSVPGGLGHGTMAWEPARYSSRKEKRILQYWTYTDRRNIQKTRSRRCPGRTQVYFDRPMAGADISWHSSRKTGYGILTRAWKKTFLRS